MKTVDPLESVNLAKRDSVQAAEQATPGPWNYAPLLSASENDHGWIVAVPGARVADVWPMCDEDGNASPEAQANARLIAAAPTMHEALSVITTILNDYRTSPDLDARLDEWMRRYCFVADKAEGRDA